MNRCTNFSEVTLFYFIIFHCFLFPSFAFVYHLIRIRYPRGEQVAQVSPSPFSHSLLLERTDSITKFNLPAGFVRISTRVEDLRFSEWPFTTFSQGNQLPDQAAHQMIINEAHGSVKVMYTQLTKPWDFDEGLTRHRYGVWRYLINITLGTTYSGSECYLTPRSVRRITREWKTMKYHARGNKSEN